MKEKKITKQMCAAYTLQRKHMETLELFKQESAHKKSCTGAVATQYFQAISSSHTQAIQ